MNFPPTAILRHRRENLKKCSLRGLEPREDMTFLTYPKHNLPLLDGFIMLSMDGPLISDADCSRGLFVLDATWRYAAVMGRFVEKFGFDILPRSLPSTLRTAYPRRQDDCADPERGLASVEALFAAYFLMGRDTTGLLDHYHWRDEFLLLNEKTFGSIHSTKPPNHP